MLNLVTARARTRGKSPVEFQFQAVGRLKPRFVTDKDNNPILVSGDGTEKNPTTVVKYSLVKEKDKDGKETGKEKLPFKLDSTGNPIAPEGTRFIEVDDVQTSGVTDNLQDVLDLFGSLTDDERGKRTALQMVIDSALDGFNYASRKNAAPVSEQVTEDELTPITAALSEYKILDEQNATTWRRTVTGTAKLMEMERLAFAKTTPQYKKLIAAGWKPVESAA